MWSWEEDHGFLTNGFALIPGLNNPEDEYDLPAFEQRPGANLAIRVYQLPTTARPFDADGTLALPHLVAIFELPSIAFKMHIEDDPRKNHNADYTFYPLDASWPARVSADSSAAAVEMGFYKSARMVVRMGTFIPEIPHHWQAARTESEPGPLLKQDRDTAEGPAFGERLALSGAGALAA